MKVTLTKSRDLNDPHLEIDLDLTHAKAHIVLTYTCPKCAGYGCRHGNSPCDDNIPLIPGEVVPTLGPEAKAMLKELFDQILGS